MSSPCQVVEAADREDRLFSPQNQVNDVFTPAMVRNIVPIVADEAEAFRFAAP